MKTFTQRFYAIVVMSTVCFTLISCNLISLKNASNDFRWKNQKFKESYNMGFDYQPEVTVSIPKINEPWFFEKKDTVGADKNYRVKELLQKKFGKRNMVFTDSSAVTLRIDKLLFKEYSESVTVDATFGGGSIGESSKDYFIFEISGSLISNDSVIAQINVKEEYNTEPRESNVFDGVIVTGGAGTRADKMIENNINLFTYRVYKAITKPEKAIALADKPESSDK